MGEQLIVLEDHAHLLADPDDGAGIAVHLLAAERDLSALYRLKSVDAAQERALTAPGRTHDHHDFPLTDR